MASPFSWSDTVQIAFGSCLPCLKKTPSTEEEPQNHNPAINRIPRARPDELQGLLADPDTDVEAERMSLHSNPGRQRNRNKKKRRAKQNNGNRRKITLFGYDLFGRAAPPPIQLPNDADDALYPDSQARRARPKSIATAHSTASTLDSDAAPLDSEAIAAMSSPSAIEAAAQAAAEAEAQRLKEKEERRKRRREKKELKRVAEALARQGVVGDGEGQDFEGFQGSGATNPGYTRIPNMFPGTLGPTSDSGSGSAFSSPTKDGFGHFVSAPAPPPGPYIPPTQDDEGEAADLDGGTYARRPPRSGPGAERSGAGSDSRSRTSASMSDRAHQFPDVLAHLQTQARTPSQLSSPTRPQFQSQPELGEQPKKRSKKSKSASSRTTRSHSSATTSQSPSLASPSLPAFPAEVQEVVSPSTVEQGQGFFDLEDEHLPVRNSTSTPQAEIPKTSAEFPRTRIGGGGFPMTGFGGGGARKARDFGAFLARRGDDEGVDGL